jgi:hypothetical protein
MIRSTRSSVSVLAGALALVALSGCSGGDGKSTPTSEDYDDVAQSLTAVITVQAGGGELGSMADTANLALGVTPNDVSVDADGTFGAARAGLHYSYAVTCTDATGAKLPKCGATANVADATVGWNGELTLPNLEATVDRSGHWTLSGLQTGAPTLDGNGTFDLDAHFTSLFRNESGTAHLSFTSAYAAVHFGGPDHRPDAGTIHYAVQASHAGTSGQASFAIDATLTFNADGSAKLVLDGAHVYAITSAGWLVKV